MIRERIDKEKALAAAAEAAEAAAAERAEAGDWVDQFVDQWNDGAASEAGTAKSSVRGSVVGSVRGGAAEGEPIAPTPMAPRPPRDEVATMLSSAGGAAETKEWDGSTSVGGGDGHGPSKSARAAAEELLALDPDLAKKHSVKSLAAATETALSKPKL